MSFSTLGNFGRNAGIRAVQFSIRDLIFALPDTRQQQRRAPSSIKCAGKSITATARVGTDARLNVSRTYGCRRPIIVVATLDCLLRQSF